GLGDRQRGRVLPPLRVPRHHQNPEDRDLPVQGPHRHPREFHRARRSTRRRAYGLVPRASTVRGPRRRSRRLPGGGGAWPCHSKTAASRNRTPRWSFSESVGGPETGHPIPRSRSSQMIVRSCSGTQKSVALYKSSAWSESTRNPWANPTGIHAICLFSALSSMLTHLPNVGDERRMSTATSNTVPTI